MADENENNTSIYDPDAPSAQDLAAAERWGERTFEIGEKGELIETTGQGKAEPEPPEPTPPSPEPTTPTPVSGDVAVQSYDAQADIWHFTGITPEVAAKNAAEGAGTYRTVHGSLESLSASEDIRKAFEHNYPTIDVFLSKNPEAGKPSSMPTAEGKVVDNAELAKPKAIPQVAFTPTPTFTKPIGAVETEWDAQGMVTVYRLGDVDYYTPASTMWEKGYKTSEEYLRIGGEARAEEPREGLPAPWVAVTTSEGIATHITREQAIALSELKGEALFGASIKLGLIPEGSKYVRTATGWGYYTPEQLKAIEAQKLAETKSEAQRRQILESIPPLVITIEDNQERLNPMLAGKAAAKGELNAEIIRRLGYDISDEELANWARISSVLDQIKIRVTETKELGLGAFPVTTTGYNYITAVQKGLLTADDLRTLGFQPEDVNTIIKTANLETKLEPYKKTTTDWFTSSFEKRDYTDIGQALVDKVITKDDLIGLGYTKEAIDKAEVYSQQGLKVWIPVYGTIATWGISSGFERGLSVVGDALFIVPTVGWLGKAGSIALKASKASELVLKVGIAPKIGVMTRVGAAAKALGYAGEQLVASTYMFPIQVLKSPKVALKGLAEVTAFPFVHPLETAKGIGAVATGRAFLGEPATTRAIQAITNRAAILLSGAGVPTKGAGVERLYIDKLVAAGIPREDAENLSLEAMQRLQYTLSDMFVRGEKIPDVVKIPIYNKDTGEILVTIGFPQDRLMRDLGLIVHSSPFPERTMTGAAVTTVDKVYFSPAGVSEKWPYRTSGGLTTPEVIQMGRGNATLREMRIGRYLDPVSKTYRNTIESEVTTSAGKQLVTSNKQLLTVLSESGNIPFYSQVAMEETPSRDIVNAIRMSEGKQFTYKPINFDEIESLPKEQIVARLQRIIGSGASEEDIIAATKKSFKIVEEFIKANDIMVGGSAAERTWTDTIHIPEDIDLISLKNNAKLDAERLAKIFEDMGVKVRIKTPEQVGREVYRIEKLNPKTNEWEQVTDVLDYSVHRTYNPNILNRESITIDGIKVEHPLEQAERINAKVDEIKAGKVDWTQSRGHEKRLGWMAQKMLDTTGGTLTPEGVKTLEVIGARIAFPDITPEQMKALRWESLVDTIRDTMGKVIKPLERIIRVKLPDGVEVEMPESAAKTLESFLRNNPNATKEQIEREIMESFARIVFENVARSIEDGSFRAKAEKVFETNPNLKGYTEAERNKFIDDMIALELGREYRRGRFKRDDIRAMFYAGVLTSGTVKALYDLARQLGEKSLYRGLEEYIPREIYELYEPKIRRERIPPEATREEIPRIEEPYRPLEEGYRPLEEPRIPLREPYRPPEEARIPPEEPRIPPREPYEPYRPPEEPYKPYIPPREPRYPRIPYVPPPKPVPVLVGKPTYQEFTGMVPPATLEWRQGDLFPNDPMNDSWWYILPPYRQEDFHWSKKALPGTYKWATGKGSAYATIQVLGGNPPEDVDVDMGIALVHIKAKGKDVEIDFTQDAADTYKGKPYHIKPPSMGKRKNPITAITTSVKELTEAFKNEGSQGDIGFSLKEAQDYYKRGDKPIESTITQELKRDDDLTLYGARAVNAQLPKYLQSHTDDFDIYTSESSVIQAKRLEKILDKKYGGNYFRVEPAQYKGTFHIKSNITNRTIADMTVTKDDIPHKEVDGMNVATLDFQVDKIRESLSNPESKFRRGKDLEALQRILIGRTLAKEKKKIEAPVSLAIKREKKAEEKPSFPILPSRYYLGRKLRDANLGDIV